MAAQSSEDWLEIAANHLGRHDNNLRVTPIVTARPDQPFENAIGERLLVLPNGQQPVGEKIEHPVIVERPDQDAFADLSGLCLDLLQGAFKQQ